MSSAVKLKYLGQFQGGVGFPEREQGIRDAEFPFYKVKDLGKSDLYLTETDNYVPEETAKSLGATILEPNCIVFAKVGAALLLQRFRFLSTPGCIDNNMMGFTVSKKVEHRFARYSLSKLPFSEIVNPGAVPSLNEEQIRNLEITWFPFQTQTKIANYLDQKTAELDQLIGAKQRLLKLLDEKKRVLIARAVTRGLNPDIPLKDSGIRWLGQIPAHWKKTIVKRLFTFAKRQGYPDLEVLSVYREYGVIIKSSRSDNNNRTPENLTKYQLVEPGDLVINKMKAWQGSMGISKYTGITSPDYVVYEKNHNEDGEFLHYLLRAPFMPNVYRMFSNGIRLSQWRLEPEHFENLILFLPPVEEQNAIIAVVKKQLGKLDALKSITEKTIILLQERRTALISAAVTGKLGEEILNAGIGTQTDEPVETKSGEHSLCLT
jgi:type I restriction enzyme, S subunit